MQYSDIGQFQTILGSECIGDSLPKINSNMLAASGTAVKLLTQIYTISATLTATQATVDSILLDAQELVAGAYDSVANVLNDNATIISYGSRALDTLLSYIQPLTANWDAAYTAVDIKSPRWDSVYSGVTATSANWDAAYTAVNTKSPNWDAAYTAVNTKSPRWDSVYSSVTATSASWDAAYTAVNTKSPRWDSVYSGVTATSASWNTAYTAVNTKSPRWDSVYSSVTATSASWDAAYTAVNTKSPRWDSVYSSVTATSASWNTAATLSSNANNYPTRNGYCYLPGNLLMQFGRVAGIATNSTTTVPFHIPYKDDNSVLNITLGHAVNSGQVGGRSCNIRNISKTNFTLVGADGTQALYEYWTALGYA